MIGVLIYLLIGIVLTDIKLLCVDFLAYEPRGWKIFYYIISVMCWPMMIALALVWLIFILYAKVADWIDRVR